MLYGAVLEEYLKVQLVQNMVAQAVTGASYSAHNDITAAQDALASSVLLGVIQAACCHL